VLKPCRSQSIADKDGTCMTSTLVPEAFARRSFGAGVRFGDLGVGCTEVGISFILATGKHPPQGAREGAGKWR